MNEQPTNSNPLGRTIAYNLRRTLEVAGKSKSDAASGPLRSTELQRKTGIARSTLRALKEAGSDKDPNPDTRTLARIAKQLGIPAGLLLLDRAAWQTIIAALDSVPEMMKAADVLRQSGTSLSEASAVLKILRCVGVYPARARPTGDLQIDQQVAAEIAERNELTRRTAFVLGSLVGIASAGAEGRYSQANVMAFAAALANQGFNHQG